MRLYCQLLRMRWSGAIGAIARCKNRSTGYVHKHRAVRAWRWTCGAKPKPKAVNKPLHRFILHGLDKPGAFTTVSTKPLFSNALLDETIKKLGVRPPGALPPAADPGTIAGTRPR